MITQNEWAEDDRKREIDEEEEEKRLGAQLAAERAANGEPPVEPIQTLDDIPRPNPPAEPSPEPEVAPEPQPEPQETTSEYASPQDAAENAQKVEREEGFVTQLGNTLDYVLTDGNISSDLLNAGANLLNQVSGGRLQGLDDAVKGSQELKETETQLITEAGERIAAGEGNVGDRAVLISEGITEGAEGGVAIPFTIAARLLNQASPWADPPETIKNSPLAETAFEITQILVPTLLTGGVTGLASGGALLGKGGALLAGESLLETATQDSAEDLIAGRTLAGKLGEVADYMGMDGTQLTQDLIEGNKPQAQAINAAAGFLQNLGINVGAEQLFKQVGKRLGRGKKTVSETGDVQLELPITKTDEKVAEILKKDPQDVAKSLDDTNQPLYSADAEPADVKTIDSSVPTTKPSPGNTSVNTDAVLASFIGEPDKALSERLFAVNLENITQGSNFKKALAEAAEVARKITDSPNDLRIAATRADTWIKKNFDLLEGTTADIDRFRKNFLIELTTDLPPGSKLSKLGTYTSKQSEDLLKKTERYKLNQSKLDGDDVAEELLENSLVNTEGFIAMHVIGEEIGTRMRAVANELLMLEKGGPQPQDYTATMERFLAMNDIAQQFLVPLRRAKRRWGIDGLAQQTDAISSLKKASTRNERTLEPLSVDANSRAYQRLERTFDDVGNTPRELWEIMNNVARRADGELPYTAEGAKWLDYTPDDIAKAKATLMSYISAINSNVGLELKLTEKLDDIVKRAWQKGSTDATAQIFYASMVTNPDTMRAAGGSSVMQLITEPLMQLMRGGAGKAKSVITRQTQSQRSIDAFAMATGRMGGILDDIQLATRQFNNSWQQNRAISGEAKFEAITGNLSSQRKQLDASYASRMQVFTNEFGADGNMMDKLTLQFQYIRQRVALWPGFSLGTRVLTAMDEATKATLGQQIARGKANITLANGGLLPGKEAQGAVDFDKAYNYWVEQIFEGAETTGKLKDPDVIASANLITMQGSIPTDGNFIDRTFLGVENFSNSSFLPKFFLPFTRVSYWGLESFGRHTLLNIPYVAENIPRYKKILAGEYGEIARMQLESQKDFGALVMSSITGLALFGGATGVYTTGNAENHLPRNSFIIPDATSENGYIAVPYGRMEPYASIISATIDITNAFKDHAISEQNYDQMMLEMTTAIAVASMDKTFLTGFTNMSALFDTQNYTNPQKVTNMIADVVSGISPIGAPLRMFGNVLKPYKTFDLEKENYAFNFFKRLDNRALGGLGGLVADALNGNDDSKFIKYDVYTGQPITKTGNADNDNYWEQVGAGLASQLLPLPIAGRFQGSKNPNDPVIKLLQDNDYFQPQSWYQTAHKIGLTREQQSILSKEIHDTGKLHERLSAYISKNNKDSRGYHAKRELIDKKEEQLNTRGISSEDRQRLEQDISRLQDRINNDIRLIHDQAKDDALEVLYAIPGSGDKLREDILFQQSLERTPNFNADSPLPPNPQPTQPTPRVKGPLDSILNF